MILLIMENIGLKLIAIVIFSGIWGWVVFGAKFSEDKTFVKIVATLVYLSAIYNMLSKW